METKWVGANSNNYQKGRGGKQIKKIVMHWIVGTLESADATFQKPDRIASAHYGIGDDEIHQYVKEEDTAYHAGNWTVNQESIGIEHEGGWLLPDKVTRFKPTDKTHETSAKLVADICARYNIPIDRTHIIKHSEVKATQCPGLLDVDKIISLAKNVTIDNNVINDQTKIPLGGEWGMIEVQAIRSKLNDQKKELDNLKDTINTLTNSLNEQKKEIERLSNELAEAKKGLQKLSDEREALNKKIEKLQEQINSNEPIFTNSLAKLFYSLAKAFEK